MEAVYPYEKFVAQFYDEKQDKLTVSNTAQIAYRLKGGAPDGDEAKASIDAGEVTLPAQITISKYIVNAQGGSSLYSAENFPAGGQPLPARPCSPSPARMNPCPIFISGRTVPIGS